MPTEGTLHFAGGETMKVIEVSILPKDDEIEEGQEVKRSQSSVSNIPDEVAFAVKLSDCRFKDDSKHKADNIERPKIGKKDE